MNVGQGTFDVKHTQVAKPPGHVWRCVRFPEIAVACGYRHIQDLLTMREPVMIERTV